MAQQISSLLGGSDPVPGRLSNQGEESINFVFHKGSFKKKVLKYGTPKPRSSEHPEKFQPFAPVLAGSALRHPDWVCGLGFVGWGKT